MQQKDIHMSDVCAPAVYAQTLTAMETERQLAQAAAVLAGEKADICSAHMVSASVHADEAAARAGEASFFAEQSSEQAVTAANAAKKAVDAATNLQRTENMIRRMDARISTVETALTTLDETVQAAQRNPVSNLAALTNMDNILYMLHMKLRSGFEACDCSLTDWCDCFASPGIQIAYIGGSVTDTPKTNCVAYYACNHDCSHRVIWLFADNGKLYTRTYNSERWGSWYAFSGNVVTV